MWVKASWFATQHSKSVSVFISVKMVPGHPWQRGPPRCRWFSEQRCSKAVERNEGIDALSHGCNRENMRFHQPFYNGEMQPTIWCGYISPNSVLLGVLNAFLRCLPWCWMVRPPSRGSCSPLVSHGTPSCFLCWMVRLPSLLVSLAWMPEGLVSHCTPSCCPLLDGVSAFPLSPHMCASVDGVSAFSRFVSPSLHPSPCGWCACAPSHNHVPPCLPLSPIVSPCVCLCWMVCPPSRGLVSHGGPTCVPLLDGVSAFSGLVSPCLHVCAPFKGVSPLVSHCFPMFGPVLEGVSAFPRPCLPLSPQVCACVGWCVRLLEALSPLVASCLPLSPIVSHCPPLSPIVSHCFHCLPLSSIVTCVPVLGGVSEVLSPLVSLCLPLPLHMCACWMVLRSCLPLSPIVSPHVCLCWMVCPPS